jgi:nitrate reductase beta subunit
MVYNWQIGREMEYPYDEHRPKRQWAGVFDTNKCIGCQTCSLACKTTWTNEMGQEYMMWNNVETKPYGFYPIGWDVRLLELLGAQRWNGGVYKGKTIFEARRSEEGTIGEPPTVNWSRWLDDEIPGGPDRMLGFTPSELDWAHPNIGEDEVGGESISRGTYINSMPHPSWFMYLPRICNHCTYPGCLAACPIQVIYKRRQDGIVLIDQSRCRGIQACIKGCPYKKSMFRSVRWMSEKCIGCYPKTEQGLSPQCFEMCIGKIRINGFVSLPENANPENPIDLLVHVKKVALPLYPQFGTEPNVYYIPPIHVPINFLRQLFGPGARDALETYKRAIDDEELLGLLHLFGSSPKTIESFRVQGGEAIGYDRGGNEVTRVPIREPTSVRSRYDENLDVYRLDIT